MVGRVGVPSEEINRGARRIGSTGQHSDFDFEGRHVRETGPGPTDEWMARLN